MAPGRASVVVLQEPACELLRMRRGLRLAAGMPAGGQPSGPGRLVGHRPPSFLSSPRPAWCPGASPRLLLPSLSRRAERSQSPHDPGAPSRDSEGGGSPHPFRRARPRAWREPAPAVPGHRCDQALLGPSGRRWAWALRPDSEAARCVQGACEGRATPLTASVGCRGSFVRPRMTLTTGVSK